MDALHEHDGGNDEERNRIEGEKDQRGLPRRRHWYPDDFRRKPIGIELDRDVAHSRFPATADREPDRRARPASVDRVPERKDRGERAPVDAVNPIPVTQPCARRRSGRFDTIDTYGAVRGNVFGCRAKRRRRKAPGIVVDRCGAVPRHRQQEHGCADVQHSTRQGH